MISIDADILVPSERWIRREDANDLELLAWAAALARFISE
jgi:hypothetical protein